jgi:hypothetical protein
MDRQGRVLHAQGGLLRPEIRLVETLIDSGYQQYQGKFWRPQELEFAFKNQRPFDPELKIYKWWDNP